MINAQGMRWVACRFTWIARGVWGVWSPEMYGKTNTVFPRRSSKLSRSSIVWWRPAITGYRASCRGGQGIDQLRGLVAQPETKHDITCERHVGERA